MHAIGWVIRHAIPPKARSGCRQPIDIGRDPGYEYLSDGVVPLEVLMKTLLMTMALVGLLAPLAACENLSDSPAENRARIANSAIIDLKQIGSDVDNILFIDRPIWLTRYPMPSD